MNSEQPHFIDLTLREIVNKSSALREGTGDKKDACQLLQYFCQLVDNNDEIPRFLLLYLSDSFKDYLNKNKKIEAALGLVRKKGRPEADIQGRQEMATEVLRLRLEGTSHQDALIIVSEKFSCGQTKVGEAWAEYPLTALTIIRNERPHDMYPWTEKEKEKLNKMFPQELWWDQREPT